MTFYSCVQYTPFNTRRFSRFLKHSSYNSVWFSYFSGIPNAPKLIETDEHGVKENRIKFAHVRHGQKHVLPRTRRYSPCRRITEYLEVIYISGRVTRLITLEVCRRRRKLYRDLLLTWPPTPARAYDIISRRATRSRPRLPRLDEGVAFSVIPYPRRSSVLCRFQHMAVSR